MDDNTLKKLLAAKQPPDEAAKRRAIALARAAFEEETAKARNAHQGSSALDRLIVNLNSRWRRRSMNRAFVFGGMATAAVALLAVGLTTQHIATLKPVRTAEVRVAEQPAPQPRDLAAADPASGDARAGQRPTPPSSPPTAAFEARPVMPVGQARQRAAGVVPGMAEGTLSRMGVAPADRPAEYYREVGRNQFAPFAPNTVQLTSEHPVSTFSIDVDTASYSFVRRQLMNGVLPARDAVRIEELINYFDYAYPKPETKEVPFRPQVAVMPAPWAPGRKLVRIAIQGYEVTAAEKPRSNLVFLIDVSGSMNSPDRLPLVRSSMKMLLDSLKPEDTVGIVVYAGAAGKVLDPTPVKDRQKILEAIDRLEAGGSTAGAEGIRQAYQMARANFDASAVNRVILATDGDFNVGITDPRELQDFIERQRQSGVYLSILGVGAGNLNDRLMQALAQNGNGTAAYIDTLNEARKVLVEEASGTLFPIAKDVKIQVEFNPATVAEYRLIGYETRLLNREDFTNDAVDAGEVGAGRAVTALYEITPVAAPRRIAPGRYGEAKTATDAGTTTAFADEYAFLKIRYTLPTEDASRELTTPITIGDDIAAGGDAGNGDAGGAGSKPLVAREARWAAAVAAFGELLKGGRHTGGYSFDDVIRLAQENKGDDPFGYRAEFIQLVRLAKTAPAMRAE